MSYHDEWSRAAPGLATGLSPTTLTKQSLVNKFLAAYIRAMHKMQAARQTVRVGWPCARTQEEIRYTVTLVTVYC